MLLSGLTGKLLNPENTTAMRDLESLLSGWGWELANDQSGRILFFKGLSDNMRWGCGSLVVKVLDRRVAISNPMSTKYSICCWVAEQDS